MIQSFSKINKVSGTLSLPGDKSISHRALLISSLAKGVSSIVNLPDSEDIKSTIHCLKSLGIKIETSGDKTFVYGRGFKGYSPPSGTLKAGNSGTTARLLSGILAAQNFESVIEGDASLSTRPMKRILEPLILMGSTIRSSDGKLPIKIYPAANLKSVNYELPIASAQVKSAILLAGLHLEDESSVIESVYTRNHTENLLDLSVKREEGKITSISSRKNYPEPKEYFIPGDISSAMCFIVLTLLSKNSELMLNNVSLNPSRIESTNLLKRMGGNIQIEINGESNNELYGDMLVKSSELSNVKIDPEIISLIMDEIPILAVAGIFSEGVFEVRGAYELRVKESDRIKSLISNFHLLGLDSEEYEDGFRISGEIKKSNYTFNSFGDHRIAMAFAILSSLLQEGGKVEGFESVAISNPDFLDQINSIAR
ncbi:MAG: 3-phosphoshikimate 1-carboxyvinyltransferase [Ignavibacteriaceae bacterium]